MKKKDEKKKKRVNDRRRKKRVEVRTDLDSNLSDGRRGSERDGRQDEGSKEGGLREDHLGYLKKAEGKGDGKRMEETGQKEGDGIVDEGSLVS
jgi:hypothetical protein